MISASLTGTYTDNDSLKTREIYFVLKYIYYISKVKLHHTIRRNGDHTQNNKSLKKPFRNNTSKCQQVRNSVCKTLTRNWHRQHTPNVI